MMTRRWFSRLGLLGALALASETSAPAQVIERDVSITGPRGNTIERQVRTERVGNVIDRQINIRRPGGVYRRETEIIAPGGFRGPMMRPGPGYYGGPGFIGVPFVAAPAFSFFLGTAPPPPPPVIIAGPPPVYLAPLPPPAAPDAVAIEIEALNSLHSNHRRDAAIALGKYGDPRSVPALIDRLKHDYEKDVRQAAAWALAEVGDSRAIVPLEVAAQYDKKAEVRAVATKSLARMPSEQPRRVSTAIRPSPTRTLTSTPAESAGSTRRAAPVDADDVPPPDPTPSPRAEPDSGFGYPRTSR